MGFPTSKWRRERVSSPKKQASRLKMTTRKGLVAKKWHFPAQNDDEKGSRRQKREFFGSKWRRERVSSPKKGVFRLKMTTRKGLVAKKRSFSPQSDDEKESRRQKKRSFSAQNDDEKEPRRQKKEFFGLKWWRERVSSPKNGVSHLKMTTRMNLVAKIEHFPPQKGDEKESRRQKVKFPAKKWRRERISSPKKGVFRLKMVTRKGLVAKKVSFSA